MDNLEYLISAAGGNITAIRVIDNSKEVDWYIKNGTELGVKFEELGAEQSGFLIKNENHFQMAGGEFCGNATRAAAVVFSDLKKNSSVDYTVSGFNGVVNSSVEKTSLDNEYTVESIFSGMQIITKEVEVDGGIAVLVDLGGIVHIVINGVMPDDYENAHRKIVDELKLNEFDAVGVIWYTKEDLSITIHPVIWVRDIDSFFYETSCGSGSIATAKVTGFTDIRQVTKEVIHVMISKKSVSLKSKMKIIYKSI